MLHSQVIVCATVGLVPDRRAQLHEAGQQLRLEQLHVEVCVHIQILENDTLQDRDAVVALFLASLAQYKSAHMEVEEVIFSSDNAACYHCEDTVVRLWSQRKAIAGVTILGLHFGEPGKGKYICDQYFAILKALMRRFRAANNDVDTPRKFAQSLCSDGGAANTVIQLGDVEGRRDEKMKKGKKVLKDIMMVVEKV